TRLISIDTRPALRFTKTVVSPPQPAPLVIGAPTTYELQAFNDGPFSARLGIVDPLPSGVTYLAATGDGWECGVSTAPDPGAPDPDNPTLPLIDTVNCNRSDVTVAGADVPPVELSVLVTPAAATAVTNTATLCHLCGTPAQPTVDASAT